MSDLLPKNSTKFEKNLSETMDISNIPVPIKDVWNPETCREDMLPWLAWAFSVDEWNTEWTKQQKRDVIKASLNVHRHKGTIGAVKAALEALGFSVQVQEWFNQTPTGEPYTFRLIISVDQVGYNVTSLMKLQKVVDTAKNLRSHLSLILPIISSSTSACKSCVSNCGHEITIKYAPTSLIINEHSFVVPEA